MNEQHAPGIGVGFDAADFGTPRAKLRGIGADGRFAKLPATHRPPLAGERPTDAVPGPIDIEHGHRYCLARDLCTERDVLDVASGGGRGASFLADVARRVVGVEIDAASVATARRTCSAANVAFLVGDALALPIQDGSIDVVVCFGALDDTPDPERLIREFRRVLRPDGILCVGLPDWIVDSGSVQNRIGLSPLSRSEFERIVGNSFRYQATLAQRALVGSVVAPLSPSGGGWRTYQRRSDDRIEAEAGLSRATHVIAVASNAPLPPVGASVYAHSAAVVSALPQPAFDQAQDAHADLRRAHLELSRRAARLQSEILAATNQRAEAQGKLEVARGEAELARAAAASAAEYAAALRQELSDLRSSTLWRALEPVRIMAQRAPRTARFLQAVIRPIYRVARSAVMPKPLPAAPSTGVDAAARYADWIQRFDTLDHADREQIRALAAAVTTPDLLLVQEWRGDSGLDPAVAFRALRLQLHRRWRAVVLADSEGVAERLRHAAEGDPRIVVTLRGDVRAAAGEGPREDEHLVLVANGVVLREHALAVMAAAAVPGIGLVYADEDSLDENGRRCSPFFKQDFAPELLRHIDYLTGCTLLAAPRADRDAVFGEAIETGAVSAALLGYAARQDRETVVHLPIILHHVVGVQSRSRGGRAEPPARDRVPVLSIIIPTRNRVDLLAACLGSIGTLTDYPRDRLEVIVVDNGSDDPETIGFLEAAETAGEIRVLRDDGPFNFARLNNVAVASSRGEVLVFLNNDTMIDDPRWLHRLAAHALQEDVGVVGARLLYPDRTIQHGGIVVGIHGVAGHVDVGAPEDSPGYFGTGSATREVLAVTGACLAIRRAVFDRIGGFREQLAVAFNDIVLCLDVAALGYRNLCVGNPLIIHFESRSRGFDDTSEKQIIARNEAIFSRRQHPWAFRNDPSYNPNLSLLRPYELAFPPRRRRPWRAPKPAGSALRLLLLSITHEQGHGVPVVIDRHATFLAQRGHRVFVAGPRGRREMPYDCCERVVLDTPEAAAEFAIEQDVDCVIAHTPPFFSTLRWLGEFPRTICYDYGEPPAELFPDAQERRIVLQEKALCFATAHRVFAISDAVRDEANMPGIEVMPLGNAHLAVWSADMLPRRDATRVAHGWEGRCVVLNVCRFHAPERRYKGVDLYIDVMSALRDRDPGLAARTVFVLCGKADPEDVAAMRAQGLTVFANVSDVELIDLYAAADIYLNMSRWEGYNLGIGQALALGLPVLASDIPAHRAFPAFTSNDPAVLAGRLQTLANHGAAGGLTDTRKPVVFEWEERLRPFAAAVEALCAETDVALPRHPR